MTPISGVPGMFVEVGVALHTADFVRFGLTGQTCSPVPRSREICAPPQVTNTSQRGAQSADAAATR